MKTKYRLHIILLILLLGSFITFSNGQEPSVLDKKAWQEKAETLSYIPKEKKPEKKKKQKNSNFSFPKGLQQILTYIGLGLVGLAIIFILFTVIRNYIGATKNKNLSSKLNFEELEEDLKDADLDEALNTTIEAQDYKESVRVSFLMVLQLLSEKRYIHYQKDKTNRNYKKDLRIYAPKLENGFKTCSANFEHVIYSDLEINAARYEQVKKLFDTYIHSINKPLS